MQADLQRFVTNLVANETKEWLSHHDLPPLINVPSARSTLYQSMTPILILNRFEYEISSDDFKKKGWTVRIGVVHACYTSLETYETLTQQGIALCDYDPHTVPFLITVLNSELVSKLAVFHDKFIALFYYFMKDIAWLPTVQDAFPKLEAQYQKVKSLVEALPGAAYRQLHAIILAAIPRPVFTAQWLLQRDTVPPSYVALETFKTHLQHLAPPWLTQIIRDLSHDIFLLYIESFLSVDATVTQNIPLFTTRLQRDFRQILAYLEPFELGQTELVDIPVLLGKLLTVHPDDLLHLWVECASMHALLTLQHLSALLACRTDIPQRLRECILNQAKK